MDSDSERFIPVIIGVGQVNDRLTTHQESLDPPDLMVASLREAEKDTGVRILEKIDYFEHVHHASFEHLNSKSARRVITAIGASPILLGRRPPEGGHSPIRLLNDVANRIGRGEIQLAAIAG